MTDGALVQDAAGTIDDIVGSQPSGLVDNKNAIHERMIG
jgi:hypothetical protein